MPAKESPGRGGAQPRPSNGARLLAEEVYEQLLGALTAGTLAPGARLNLDQLARQMHVSNTPIRHALGRLEEEGLVVRHRNRGFVASELLDRSGIIMAYEFRLLIEPTTAALAARRRATHPDHSGFGELAALCAADLEFPLPGDTARDESLAERDTSFHTLIASVAGNIRIAEHLKFEMRRMCRFAAYSRLDESDMTWVEHREIAESILASDADAAAASMRTHLVNGLRRLIQATAGAESDQPPARVSP